MRANLVRGPPRVCSFLFGSVFVNPIQKLTNFFASNFFKRNTAAPACPFPKCRGILLTRSLSWISRTKVLWLLQFRELSALLISNAAALAPMHDPIPPAAFCCASCRLSYEQPVFLGCDQSAPCRAHDSAGYHASTMQTYAEFASELSMFNDRKLTVCWCLDGDDCSWDGLIGLIIADTQSCDNGRL